MTDRRSFLKTAAAATTAAACAPLLTGCENGSKLYGSSDTGLIVPKAQGLKITGTFLDEISHDIPHQNWGPKEWEQDFRNMKAIGIDTVIMIRSGYRKFITWPCEYLLKKGCYMPSIDLLELFLSLADKYGMKFYYGLYDSGVYWDTGNMMYETEVNKFVIDEVWAKYGHHKRVSRAGICPPRFHAPPRELWIASTPWARCARTSPAACLPSFPLGLTARRPSAPRAEP